MERIFEYDKEAFLKLLKRRGIEDSAVLEAMYAVPREMFVGVNLAEFAYDDTPLPIDEGQTISQPYMVALMAQEMRIGPDDRVLEVGTGSGYAAAVLSRIAGEVYTIERHHSLAQQATERLRRSGYDNVKVLCGDGTLGWPEHAPYDAIVVAAGGPEAPASLLEQLKVGGRLVIPVGAARGSQRLLRIIRVTDDELETEELGGVRFVPLVGEQGWSEAIAKDGSSDRRSSERRTLQGPDPVVEHIRRHAEPFASINSVDLEPLLERVGEARVVLLGEATHGTAEFYDMRARITKALIEQKGFSFLAVEADWPDAAQIDHFVRDTRIEPTGESTFSRFPTWMWANAQVLEFVKWLRRYNQRMAGADKAVGFYGLDLYSLYSSIDAIIHYLEQVDHEAAVIARHLPAWNALERYSQLLCGVSMSDDDHDHHFRSMLFPGSV